MKETTFGNTKAAISLVNVLTKFSNKYTKKVGRLLDKFTRGLQQIQMINDLDIKLSMMSLWRKAALEQTENLPDEIKRFTKNILIAKYREIIRKHHQSKFYG